MLLSFGCSRPRLLLTIRHDLCPYIFVQVHLASPLSLKQYQWFWYRVGMQNVIVRKYILTSLDPCVWYACCLHYDHSCAYMNHVPFFISSTGELPSHKETVPISVNLSLRRNPHFLQQNDFTCLNCFSEKRMLHNCCFYYE